MMKLIDREDHQKLYVQLYEILRKKIETNEWHIGSQIPTEEDLCKMFNVSRATVRTAVMELVRQGYLRRQQGKGTFIYKNVVSGGFIMFTSFKEFTLMDNLDLTLQILARTVMMPIDNLDVKLAIPPDKHIIYIKRLWLIDKIPSVIQEMYIPYHICPLLLEDDLERNSLFELLEKKYGIKITAVKNSFNIINIKPDESRLFKLSEGSSAIVLTQQFYSGETLIIYSKTIKKMDNYDLFIEFERKVI
jgi:GntR family transcriptional regulator